jgi:hypothetical protein
MTSVLLWNKTKTEYLINFLKIAILFSFISVVIFAPIMIIMSNSQSIVVVSIAAILGIIAFIGIQTFKTIYAFILPAAIVGNPLNLKQTITLADNYKSQIAVNAVLLAVISLALLVVIFIVSDIFIDSGFLPKPVIDLLTNYFEYFFLAVNLAFLGFIYNFLMETKY